MNKILIVEDEIAIAQHLSKFLRKEGFEIEIRHSGAGISQVVKNYLPDLILLDVMLPDKDGISCCRDIRTFSDVPIIILTAKVEEIDRLIGLKSGADDYVCKPFSAAELVLRVHAILRRNGIEQQKLSLGLHLNKSDHQIKYDNQYEKLTSLEFALFNLLYHKPQRIFSREQIIELAYPDVTDICQRAIDSHIKNLRKKIRKLNIEENVIESVYGAGYRYNSSLITHLQ